MNRRHRGVGRKAAPGHTGSGVGSLVVVWLGVLLVSCTPAGPPPGAPTPPPPDLPPPSWANAPEREAPGSRPEAAAPRPGGEDVPVSPAPEHPPAQPGYPSVRDGMPRIDRGVGVPVEGDTPVRALWVVRTALNHPDSARMAVRRAHAAGFNTLLVQVRGRGDAWYRSGREPRGTPISREYPGYDPLAVVLEEARGLGLSVHAWLNTLLVGSAVRRPSDPLHLMNRRPELLAVPRELAPRLFGMDPHSSGYVAALMAHAAANTDRVEGLYTSAVLPPVHDHLAEVVADLLLRYDVDGIHLDYVRLPNGDYDFGRAPLEIFRARLRGTRSPTALREVEGAWQAGDIFAYADAFPQEWADFQRQGVTTAVERIRGEIHRIAPGLPLTAAVFANADDAFHHRFQPWEEWLALGLVDVVVPMNYTNLPGVFQSGVERAMRAGGRDRVWMGVGVYNTSFEGAVEKSRMVREAGLSGLVLFSYDWAVGPEGRAAARGDYLGLFSAHVFGAGQATGPTAPGAPVADRLDP